MKSLVTGGAGFIGSHLVEKLLSLGHELIVIDNKFGEDIMFFWKSLASNYNYGIRDYEHIRLLLEGVDYVFHLAARVRIQTAIQNPINTVSVNSLGTFVVLQSARETGLKRLIYSFTSTAYGHHHTLNVETQTQDCLIPYSVSEVNGEQLCKNYYELFGLKTISLHYFNIYGTRQAIKRQYAAVIGIFLIQKKNGVPLTIVGDGEQRRDFTRVAML